MPRATGTFTFDTWDEQLPFDDREGGTLARMHVIEAFHGGGRSFVLDDELG